MSTRCHIIIQDDKYDKYEAILYRHSDGYPEGKFGVIADLVEFLPKFLKGRGMFSPDYCAAQLLVFMVNKSAAQKLDELKRLLDKVDSSSFMYQGRKETYDIAVEQNGNDYLGYGISNAIHGDVAYCYVVKPGCVEVYDVARCPEDRTTWKRMTTAKEAKGIMDGKVPEWAVK